MESKTYLSLNLQEKVPEHVLRTEDDFTSDSDHGSDCESENSEEIRDMDIDHGEEFENTGNMGWADAMAKILKTNTPKGRKTIVLAKAKKLSDVLKTQESPDFGFEIDGEIKDEKPNVNIIKKETEEPKNVTKIKKREWNLKARIKPNILEKNRERTLSKIATKGVVQLFNTVRDHQKKLNKKLNEAGTERKREKVLKSVDKQAFLDMLMGSTGTKIQKHNPVKSEGNIKEEDKTSWNVLREDFMMGASLKDWDKKLETPNQLSEESLKNRNHDDSEEGSDDMGSGSFDNSDRESSDEG